MSLQQAITNHLIYSIGRDPESASQRDWYQAMVRVIRDNLMARWHETEKRHDRDNLKRVYYLSMEFLIGRATSNSLHAMGLYEQMAGVLKSLGLDLDEVRSEEPDAALGNGGLGRLAACFLDSMANLGIPSYGYGIRYDYGMFAQHIHDGHQVEQPDDWLAAGNPWEVPRPEQSYDIRFGGHVRHEGGRAHWIDADEVLAMAHDNIVPGSDTSAVNTLRLWHARAAEVLDLKMFNAGNYMEAVSQKNHSENVTRVLYPDDSSDHGKELRLRQEYFFVSASIQDILARYLKRNARISLLADKVAIHLNDTHPAIAIPELMRLLVDQHRVSWDVAWKICQNVFSYTNHTIMPEALETWPVDMMNAVLPRHMEIINEINRRFLDDVRTRFPDDEYLVKRVSIIDDSGQWRVRMAWLSVIASHKVNGVSALHSDLIQDSLFADFVRIFPGRFCNKTNGITPRRWLAHANHDLSSLLDDWIGTEWRKNLDSLQSLRNHAGEASLVAALGDVKLANKKRLAAYVEEAMGQKIDPNSLFDVQIKRIHEYKRQLLNVLHIVYRYQAILADPDAGWTPRTFIFAGKAASAYKMAKLIIKLVNDISETVNNDQRVNHLMKVVFIPNYSVSLAEIIIPAADLSEQISTAGTEASGTGNMKLSINGALTIGTLDGANVEIRDQVGDENIFIFGMKTPEVAALRETGYQPYQFYDSNPNIKAVLDAIGSGVFSPDEPGRFRPIVDSLLNSDHYCLLADFESYVKCQAEVDLVYRDPDEWQQRALLNIAGMGVFSSDRTIRQYAEEIWNVQTLAG
ncbi:MAG: glycogen/starch/alpha-glucan phosphorylase [Burkholderiaceae bacterium]